MRKIFALLVFIFATVFQAGFNTLKDSGLNFSKAQALPNNGTVTSTVIDLEEAQIHGNIPIFLQILLPAITLSASLVITVQESSDGTTFTEYFTKTFASGAMSKQELIFGLGKVKQHMRITYTSTQDLHAFAVSAWLSPRY
jgi:hypothetical protein